MSTFDQPFGFIFRTRTLGDEFLRKIRDAAYKYDVVVLNDILKEHDRDANLHPQGYHYGYSKKEIRKLKVEKDGVHWLVRFPEPGRMVRDENGYWTTVRSAKAEGGG